MQLILTYFRNSSKHDYSVISTSSSPPSLPKTPFTVREKCGWVGGFVRVSADSHQSCVSSTPCHEQHSPHTHPQWLVMSPEVAQPIGSASPLPFPACSPLSQRLVARHLIFLLNNQPWKCVGRKMSKYRCSHNSSPPRARRKTLPNTRRKQNSIYAFAVCRTLQNALSNRERILNCFHANMNAPEHFYFRTM